MTHGHSVLHPSRYRHLVAIVPDRKDWTWVLERTCPECGFDTRSVEPDDVAELIRSNGAAWRTLLTGKDDVRARPSPDVWSTLEYGCHVRDAYRVYDERLRLMLTEDAPVFPNWDQDATAVADRYGEQDPAVVADEVAEAAHAIGARLDAVEGHDWQRTGSRSDGAQFTVASCVRYLLHDAVHHVYDVTRDRG